MFRIVPIVFCVLLVLYSCAGSKQSTVNAANTQGNTTIATDSQANTKSYKPDRSKMAPPSRIEAVYDK